MRGLLLLCPLLLGHMACTSGKTLLPDAMQQVLACPVKFARCIANKDCRLTMQCASHCIVNMKEMNLTCYVPCTFGKDQSRFLDFSDCVMRAMMDPDDPGVVDVPHGGVCPDIRGMVDRSFEMRELEGEWYVVAGASSLEAYDCQKNRVSRFNDSHWVIDEYYQGNITEMGFMWGQGRQLIKPTEPGHMLWQPAPGSSGYEADYALLKHAQSYVILAYCAPLKPTKFAWSSVITYAREPTLPPQARRAMQAYLKAMQWDVPVNVVNHEDCDYRLAPLGGPQAMREHFTAVQ